MTTRWVFRPGLSSTTKLLFGPLSNFDQIQIEMSTKSVGGLVQSIVNYIETT
jgi:hypothetical protein